MKKIITLIVMIALLVNLTGCTSNSKTSTSDKKATANAPKEEEVTVSQDRFKGIIEQEKRYSQDLEPIHQQVTDLYIKFNKGSISREQFKEQLTTSEAELNKIKDSSREMYKKYKLTKEEKKDKTYAEGILYSIKARTAVSAMIRIVTVGVHQVDPTKRDKDGNYVITTIQADNAKIKEEYTKKQKAYDDAKAAFQKFLETQAK